MEARMGLAEYMIVAKGSGWSVLHDGDVSNDYATKEAAFESAVAAASLALRAKDTRCMSASPAARPEMGPRSAAGND
jgi:hypothetical protein